LRSCAAPCRRDLGRGAKGGIVQHGQIVLNCSASRLRRQALLTLDALLSVGIRLDEARIDCEGFAADQALADTPAQYGLEHAAEEVTLTEAAVPVLREGGVIGHPAIEP
jgi:hypothetical protein